MEKIKWIQESNTFYYHYENGSIRASYFADSQQGLYWSANDTETKDLYLLDNGSLTSPQQCREECEAAIRKLVRERYDRILSRYQKD